MTLTWQPELDELVKREELAKRMGGQDKVERQHDAGRLTIRERVDALIDKGSLHEIGTIAGMAVFVIPEYLTAFNTANNNVMNTAASNLASLGMIGFIS